ncbi:uncharacterized protein LOC143274615 [Babylonia areolata]|uniref:uncharacterized protein LOC143274615 n=1 Tax=Babylonia areolata TaxID=304850 RepID=UPI003FD56EF9
MSLLQRRLWLEENSVPFQNASLSHTLHRLVCLSDLAFLTTQRDTAFLTTQRDTAFLTTQRDTAFLTQPFSPHSVTQPFLQHSVTQPFSPHSVTQPFLQHSVTQPFSPHSVTQPFSPHSCDTAFLTTQCDTAFLTTQCDTALSWSTTFLHLSCGVCLSVCLSVSLLSLLPSGSLTVLLSLLCLSVCLVTGLVLNMVLVLTLQWSPSLKTPPNSHLLNICCNNVMLGLQACLSLPALHLHSLHVPQGSGEALSGVQLFFVMHCLLQYWGSFASIGYYRFKTLHHPSLSLRLRNLIVSRSITVTWVISLLLAMTFSLTSARDSAYLPCTLDPFRKSFYAAPVPVGKEGGGGEDGGGGAKSGQNTGQVVVLCLVMAVMLSGLLLLLTSYYSICRTLHAAPRPAPAGRSRVAPWPPRPPPSTTPSLSSPPSSGSVETDVTAQYGPAPTAYRADKDSQLFCVSSPRTGGGTGGGQGVWVVHYHRHDHSVSFRDMAASDTSQRPGHQQSGRSASARRGLYASHRPLTCSLSTGSTASCGQPSSGTCPEFSDISLGADFVRRHKQHTRSALKKQCVRRERGSLSHASRNCLVMMTAYLLFSLPLIVCQIPGSLGHVTPERRVQVLLVCRLLFFFNCPACPLWYLLFSLRVKKCLRRMCETFPVSWHYQHR